MANCKFPLCVRLAHENGLCIPHRIYKDSGIPDLKPEKPGIPENPEIPVKAKKKGMKQKTAKQRKLEAELRKMAKAERLAGGETCEINSPECVGTFDGWHHIQKKSPLNYTNKDNLLRSCNSCNTYMEANDAWARSKGFVISKHKKS